MKRRHSLYKTNLPLFALLALAAVAGCSYQPPGQTAALNDFPIIDPDDPASIERWETSEYNFSDARISVVKLKYFHGVLGGADPQPPQSVALHVWGAKENGITPEQQSAIDELVANEAAIHANVRTAIYDYYKQSYPTYQSAHAAAAAMFGGDATEINEILPEISAGDELDGLVQIGQIYIHPPVDGVSSIGIDFGVPWDEEHGIGLRLEGTDVAAIGTGHEAFPFPLR